MSLEFPSQIRTIDPYSSYNSNVVNQLTRLITRGKNCLHGIHAIDVVVDSTASDTEITILPGECFKDDVIIQITESKTVDMSHSDYYLNHMNPWNEAGFYYVCLEYTYAKSKPAPQAKIRLLKPSQTSLYDENNSPFLLLKVVEVIFNGSVFVRGNLYDYDPSNPNNKRIYSQLYAGAEDTLIPFDSNRDEGRLIYVKDRDELFFGLENRWEQFNSIRANIDTSLCEPGYVGYVDAHGYIQPAIATAKETLANCIVLEKGVNLDGKVRLFGEASQVKIESGNTIDYGDIVYLSEHEAGTITNQKPHNYIQYLGISTSPGSVSDYCDIWFLPDRNTSTTDRFSSNEIDYYQDLLNSSIFEYLFIETFNNYDFIDSTASNCFIDNHSDALIGGNGQIYQSIPIQINGYGTALTAAQISSRWECQNSATIDWYISNNGSEDLDWEVAQLDTLHYFSTYRIEFSSTSGVFQIGENVWSDTSHKMATINGINSGQILVFGDTRAGLPYQIGETITGQTSGATGIISNIVDRQQNSYHDLRIKIVLNGNNDECKIYDFGVIYDFDEDIYKEPDIDNEKNIETLYADVYSFPSLDNDGAANLATPLETQIHDLQNYVNNTVYSELNDLRYFVDSTCCYEVHQNRNNIQDLENQLNALEYFIDSTCCVEVHNLESEYIILNSKVDNNYNILSNEINDLRYFVDSTCCYEINLINTDIHNLQNQTASLQSQIDFITDSTSAYHIAIVNSNDIDTLYSDIYESPHRDEDGNPNLIVPLETQINQLRDSLLSPTPPLIVNTADINPDVSNNPSMVRFDYSSNLTVIDFLNGEPGQVLNLVFTNDKIIIQNNANISLLSGNDFYSQNEYTLTLINNGTKWIEKSSLAATMVLDGGSA